MKNGGMEVKEVYAKDGKRKIFFTQRIRRYVSVFLTCNETQLKISSQRKQNVDTMLPALFANSTAHVAAWISAVLLVRRPRTCSE
jgi:hypothetical protein